MNLVFIGLAMLILSVSSEIIPDEPMIAREQQIDAIPSALSGLRQLSDTSHGAKWKELVAPSAPGSPYARFGHLAATWRRRYMIVHGGYGYAGTDSAMPFGDLWIFDGVTSQWQELLTSKVNRPPPRYYHFGGIDAKSDTLIVYGGTSMSSSQRLFDREDVWTIDLKPLLSATEDSTGIESNYTTPCNYSMPAVSLNLTQISEISLTWVKYPRPESGCWPSARSLGASVVLNGSLIVHGGWFEGEKYFNSMWQLVFAQGKDVRDTFIWRQLFSENSVYTVPARIGHRMVIASSEFGLSGIPAANTVLDEQSPSTSSGRLLSQMDTLKRSLSEIPSTLACSEWQDVSLVVYGGRSPTGNVLGVFHDVWIFRVSGTYPLSKTFIDNKVTYARTSSCGSSDSSSGSSSLETSNVKFLAGTWDLASITGYQVPRSHYAAVFHSGTLVVSGGFARSSRTYNSPVGLIYGDLLAYASKTSPFNDRFFRMIGAGDKVTSGSDTNNDWGRPSAPEVRYDHTAVVLDRATLQNDSDVYTPDYTMVIFGGRFQSSYKDVWALPLQNIPVTEAIKSDFVIGENFPSLIDAVTFAGGLFGLGLLLLIIVLVSVRRWRRRREALLNLLIALRDRDSDAARAALRHVHATSGTRGGVPTQLIQRLKQIPYQPRTTTTTTTTTTTVSGTPSPQNSFINEMNSGERIVIQVQPRRESLNHQDTLHSSTNPINNDDVRWEQNTCTICFGEYEPDELVTLLPCQHIFHGKCITQWLSNHVTCPICKSDVCQDLANELDSSVSPATVTESSGAYMNQTTSSTTDGIVLADVATDTTSGDTVSSRHQV